MAGKEKIKEDEVQIKSVLTSKKPDGSTAIIASIPGMNRTQVLGGGSIVFAESKAYTEELEKEARSRGITAGKLREEKLRSIGE